VVLERSVVTVGEEIRGRVSAPCEARLSVLLATSLLDPSQSLPKVVKLYESSERLEPGPFSIRPPDWLPPTVSTRFSKVRWTLGFSFGRGRLAGLLGPRGSVRIKAYPRGAEPPPAPGPPVRLEKTAWRPDEVVSFSVDGVDPEDVIASLVVEEWLELGGERRSVRYSLAEAVPSGSGLSLEVPHDPSVPRDFFLFFPYSFSAGSEIRLGVRAFLSVSTPSWEREVEVALVPRPPRFAPAGEERRGPLLPI